MSKFKKMLFAGASLFLVQNMFGNEILNRKFASDEDLKGTYGLNRKLSKIVKMDDGSPALEISVPKGTPKKKARNTVGFHLAGKKLKGRRITFSAEVKKSLLPPLTRWGGGQFSMWTPLTNGKSFYKHAWVGTGISGWKKVSKTIDYPMNVASSLLTIGIMDDCGKIYYRNLRVKEEGAFLPLEAVVNMGFADSVASDGKGGWSDQGPNQDAAKFPLKKKTFANVPFRIIDPKKNGDKSIMVFQCPNFPRGLKAAEINLAGSNITGKYFYVMSATAWGQKKGTPLGYIDIYNKDGVKHEIVFKYNIDTSDAYMPTPKENAFLAAKWKGRDCPLGAFVSKFKLPENLGPVEKVVFRHAEGATSMWMVIGATISANDFKYPGSQKLVIKENDVWKPLAQKYIPAPKAGTALDLSSLFPQPEAGTYGRVIIKNGKFFFEKKLDQPIRFLSAGTGRDYGKYFGVPSECATKEMISAYVTQMRRAGYNMVRFWAEQLRTGKQKAFEFDKKIKDKHDWFIYCLKKNGIYILYSLPNPTMGFDYCNRWTDPRLKNKNNNLYTNPDFRAAWWKGTKKLLTEVNPYTKTRLVDDPVLAMVDCNNELEFTFMRAGNEFAGIWRDFLKKKYKDFSAMKKAWGSNADGLNGFEDIKIYPPKFKEYNSQAARDKAEFVIAQERGILEWEKVKLREIGFKGPITSFLLGKSMGNLGVRKDFDYVAMNGYHAHPSPGPTMTTGGRIQQNSSVGSAANIIRSFLAARMYGKPFVVTEHGHVFWNKYRYEQGLVMGGLSALNDFDGLTAFFMPVTTHPNHALTSFEIRHDPISRASELVTALAFRRRDVKSSDVAVRVHMDLADVIRKNADTMTISSTQLQMGLLARLYVDQTTLPVKQNELFFERIGGSSAAVRIADSNVVDSKDSLFNLNSVVNKMKASGQMSKTNRTNLGKEIFESSTGQVLMDCSRNYMQVSTPRLQAICGEAGSTVKLPNFEVRKMTRRANISLAAIDGMKGIDGARRMLLIISTNVLNNGMTFETPAMSARISNGTTPLLLETGKFNVVIKNRAPLKCWALALDGTRIDNVPVKRSGDRLVLDIDTAKIKNGPSIYFELAEK